MNFKPIISATLVCILTFILTGCNAQSDDTNTTNEKSVDSLVIAVQKTTNVPLYTSSFADEYINEALTSHALFNIVAIDGKPFTLLSESITLGSTNKNENNAKAENSSQLSNIDSIITYSTGVTEKVDILEGLVLADRLHSSSTSGGTTVIASSGLSTTGALNLTPDGMLSAESDTIIAYLQSLGYSFEHTNRVVWYGFADVADEQEELTPALKTTLQNMYDDVLKALGVNEVIFEDEIVGSIATDEITQPKSSTVSIPETPTLDLSTTTQVTLTSETLPFIAGTSELADPTQALDIIKPFAEKLNSDASLTCVVRGSTASYPWDEAFAQELSEARAQTVANKLIEQGVDPSRLVVKGLGSSAKNHINDIDPDTGLQIPELAQQNRWVSIELSSN